MQANDGRAARAADGFVPHTYILNTSGDEPKRRPPSSITHVIPSFVPGVISPEISCSRRQLAGL
jgi:hypothetical protein